MDQLVAHRRAQALFAGVLANVRDEQLDAPSPCAGWSAKDVIDHVIGGNQLVRQRAGLEPIELPDGLVAAHAASARGAQEVFAAPDGLTRTFELPFATVPAAWFIDLRTADVFTHAWDLATATGQPTDLDRELAAVCLDAAKARMRPDLRGEGKPFADEQPCPPDATPSDALAAFLGRTTT
jgi:uncharacterized protein (TIGR03086 family)